MERGVYQGSPLSSTLFSISTDTCTDMVEEKIAESEHQEHPSNWDVVLLADDVKLEAKTPGKLQQPLDVSTTMAIQFDTIWSTDKCNIIATKTGGGGVRYSDWRTRNWK